MEGKTRRAVGYIRVSREGGRSQKNGGESYRTKAMQEARIKELARQHGLKIVAWQTDENQSGKSTDRPGFQAALQAIQDGEASVLVVAKLSRFARSVQDTEMTVTELDKASGSLICGDLPEMTGPFGKAFRQIMAVFAELELELAREAWADAVADAVADGVFPGKAPKGYKKTPSRGLEVDPKLAPLVRALYLGRGSGLSWAVLLKEWHQAGGPAMSRNGLQTIITSTTYRGQAKVNGHHIEVEPLVSVEEWEAAQSVEAPRPARRTGSLLGGLMKCSSCGGTMSAMSMGGGKGKGYRCQPSRSGHAASCPQRMSITMELADQVVEQALLDWAGEALEAEGVANGEQGLVAALQELESAEAELAAFQLHTRASLPGYAEALASREAEVEAAREKVAGLKASRKVETVRVRLVDIWPELELEEKRRLVAQAVESIQVIPGSGQRLGGHASLEDRVAAVQDRLIITFRSDAL